jgi:hypothetical protein
MRAILATPGKMVSGWSEPQAGGTTARPGFKFKKLVEEAGFEPATTWSQTRCATGLRYSSAHRDPNGSAPREWPSTPSIAKLQPMQSTLTSDLTVLDLAGNEVRLADLAAGRPLVLAFLRHFG